jgi:acyl dehydratase
MPREIRYDDIEALGKEVSVDFGEWGETFEVTQELIDDFAELTDDHQWIHVDRERARTGPYGATIAHGLLILALGPRLRSPGMFEVVGHGSTLNYGSDGVRFLEPVPAGAKIRSHSRVADVREHPRGTRITSEIAVHVVERQRPSMVLRAITLHTP